MTRPMRQIGDQADILTDPAAHWPQRPSWACDADGEDWPCERLRAHLLATMPAGDISLAMGPRYTEAVHELDEPAARVHDRMLGWARSPKPEQPTWHPPGGPW